MAKIRSMNHKENKEKINREKVLSDPGSELSLSNADLEMEMDYYDYNVINAGAIPGSYLGMDPAFLVWIPPLTNGDSRELVEDILPRNYPISPGSNKESPDEDALVKNHNTIRKYNDILNKNVDSKIELDSNIWENNQEVLVKEVTLKDKLKNVDLIHAHQVTSQNIPVKEQTSKKTNDSKWLDDIQYADDDEIETDFNGPSECDNRCKNVCDCKD